MMSQTSESWDAYRRQVSSPPIPTESTMSVNTFLCDELDKDALRLIYDKWKGSAVDTPRLKLALSNVLSYGIYLTPDSIYGKKGDPAPTFAAKSEEETEKAFQMLLSTHATGEVAKLGDGAFLKTILPLVLKLLAGFLV